MERSNEVLFPPTTERTDPLVGAVLVDRFRVHARIGAGGFGVVYRATQLSIDRPVAIKVLGLRASSPVARHRFQREAQVLSRLASPHTVRLIDFGILDDGRFFYVMEYLEGETLEDLIARGPIPVDVALRIAEQICHALQEAHGQQIVHRDLKPANVWIQQVSGDRVVRLLDFGTARLLDSDAVTRSEVLIGTPAYLAPEQCRSGEVDGRVDLYALGLVMFEMIAGHHPFGDGVLAEMVYRHVHAERPKLTETADGVPPMLSSLVLRLMARDPDARPPNAWAVRLELERLLVGRGASRVMGLAPTKLYDAIDEAPPLRSGIDRSTRALDREALSLIIDRPSLDHGPTVPRLTVPPEDVGPASTDTLLDAPAEAPRRWRATAVWALLLVLVGLLLGVVIRAALPPAPSGDGSDGAAVVVIGTSPRDAGPRVDAAPDVRVATVTLPDAAPDAMPDAMPAAARRPRGGPLRSVVAHPSPETRTADPESRPRLPPAAKKPAGDIFETLFR